MLKKIFNKKHIGDDAEALAKKYLEAQGLTFTTSNYHCRFGEIDLIFEDKKNDHSLEKTIVFVEVKYRQKTHYGTADEMVTYRKQQKIITTARFYLQQHQLTESAIARFDVVGISPNDLSSNLPSNLPGSLPDKIPSNKTNNSKERSPRINWIQNAFQVD